MRTSSRKISSTPICCSWAPNSVCGCPWTVGGSGRTTRAGIYRRSPYAISRSIRVITTHGRGIWIIDDISPLRALTPQVLASSVAFLPGRPTVQRLQAGGGWANGDAMYVGRNPPSDAVITYYQRRRHIFGDMKLEVFDASGKLLGTMPTSKRRGLNRVTWSMRLAGPKVPPAASAAFGAAFGPRVLPGT